MNRYSPRKNTGAYRGLLVFFSLTIILSLACNLPFIGPRPQEIPEPTPVQEVTPLTVESAAPTIVETWPLTHASLPLQGGLSLTFDQPMERTSVEGALRLQPAYPGRFEWTDDYTVKFTPDQPFPANSEVVVMVAETARSEAGLNMLRPAEFAFRTPGDLKITERLPRPESLEVDPSAAVVITFNQPIVELGGDERTFPAAFTLEPQAAGAGKWLNSSTYIFTGRPALEGGREYQVIVNPELVALNGARLNAEEEMGWTFRTANPDLIDVAPASGEVLNLDSVFSLTFNQPMDVVDVEANLRLRDSSGLYMPVTYEWDDRNTIVTVKPINLLQRNIFYTLELDAVRAVGGAILTGPFRFSYRSVGALTPVESRPQNGQMLETYGEYASVLVTFSTPLADRQNLSDLVRVSPQPAGLYLERAFDGKTVFLSGLYQSGIAYTLTVSAQLADRWGATLGEDWTIQFTAGNRQPNLSIPVLWAGGGILFTLPGESRLSAYATNLNNLNLVRASLSLDEFLESIDNGVTTSAIQGAERWTQTLDGPENVAMPVEISFRADGDGLQPGLYSIGISSPQLPETFYSPDFRLVVSSVQLTLKESQDELFIWATDLITSQVVADRSVRVYDSEKILLGSGRTDSSGVVRIGLPADRAQFSTLVAVLGEPGDVDFSVAVHQWSNGISPWDFGLESRIYQPDLKVYVYTDRPIYQPGQTVFYRAVIRQAGDARYQPTTLREAVFQLFGDYLPETGNVPLLEVQRQAVSAYGTVNGAFTLPEDARPGVYAIMMQGEIESRIEFQVAEYRKPEIDLEVAFALPEYKLGSDVRADIYARYFFGEIARNVKVSWSLYARDAYVGLPGGLQTGVLDTSWMRPGWWYGPEPYLGRFLRSGSGETGADGRFPLTFTGAELEGLLGDRKSVNLVLEVTLYDESGLPVSRRGETRLHPAEFYIGVRAETWSVSAGTPLRFDVLTVDWQEQPAGNKTLQGVFEKVEWVQDWEQAGMEEASYHEKTTPVGSVDFVTGVDGRARLEFIPEEPGTYRLDVHGNGAVTQYLVWVGGSGAAPWPRLPNQQLRLEADSQRYMPGQTARIFIPNPFTQPTLALVTVERRGVLRYQILNITTSSTVFELPVEPGDAPNVYISVVLLSRAEDGRPDFRLGYTTLNVDAALMLLDVHISAGSTRLEPRATARFEIQVRDPLGNPIQGEFSISAVDKAVLALAEDHTDDITTAFYGRQPLGVTTGLSLAAYTGRFVLEPPGRGGLGGGGGAPQLLAERTDFQDTAYWNGSFETDASGRAVIEFPVPDNLTTWVVSVRGLTRDTRVGEAVTEVLVSKDLLIRPVTPQFLVAGDRVQLGAMVNNTTSQSLDVVVHLQARGVSLENQDLAAQAIQVAAGGRQRVNWWVKVLDAQEAELVFSVQGGGLSDSTTPASGRLPILRYSAPQTFATSGILAEGGERLEVVSLPRSYIPGGGALQIEMSPSLIAAAIGGVDAVKSQPGGLVEPTVSSILANLSLYDLVRSGLLESPDIHEKLQTAIRKDLDSLISMQRSDGGWGWAGWVNSDFFVTTYAVLALEKARNAGYFVDQERLETGLNFVKGALYPPAMSLEDWELDRLAFGYYVLNQNGRTRINPTDLTALRARLSPWGQAFLAMALKEVSPEDASQIIGDLSAGAIRSASGAYWQEQERSWRNFSTPLSTTAIVVYALADFDPASPVLADAVRFLVAHRQGHGGWSCAYDTAWVLAGLVRAARVTGDLQAEFGYSATLNGETLASGRAAGNENLNPVRAVVPISQLAQSGNVLRFQREAGSGRLYYRAYLEIGQPVETIRALDGGLTVSRTYTLAGADCPVQDCPPIQRVNTQAVNPVVRVQVSITVPTDMYYLVVEDFIPAGSEIVNTRLNTTQLGSDGVAVENYRDFDPFSDGWGWWYFSQPVIYKDHIRWVAPYVPAGTYVLSYRLLPLQPGEYRVLPARAFQVYFPEVQGRSAGEILLVE